jgi:hypothetical protein
MNWPNKIDVTINLGAEDTEDRQETSATLLRSVTHYGDYGPMAEYESASGLRFWLDAEYYDQCKSRNVLPDIPMEVITKNAEIRSKLEYGQQALSDQAKKTETGLILPDGY